MKQTFYIEMTDTYGGEANYCWVRRYRVNAKSFRGAIVKLSRETGFSFRVDSAWSDLARYNVKGAAICAFVSCFEEEAQKNTYIKNL